MNPPKFDGAGHGPANAAHSVRLPLFPARPHSNPHPLHQPEDF